MLTYDQLQAHADYWEDAAKRALAELAKARREYGLPVPPRNASEALAGPQHPLIQLVASGRFSDDSVVI